MKIKGIRMERLLISALLAFAPTLSHADIVWSFQQVGSSVVMTSSGTVNLSNLLLQGTDGWNGTGYGQFDGYNLMGGTSMGQNDTTYMFHAGTDLSPWASAANIFTTSNFSPSSIAGTRPFATFAFAPGSGAIVPGLSMRASDIVGSTWTGDQVWTYNGTTLAAIGLTPGTYSIVDAVTSETLAIQIGAVPEPMSLALLGLGLFGLALSRRKSA